MVLTQRLVFLLGILMALFTCVIVVAEENEIQSEIQQVNEGLVISNTSLNEQRVRDHFNIVRKLLPLKGNVSKIENLKRLIMKNAKKSYKPVTHNTSLVELKVTASHSKNYEARKPAFSLKHGANRTSITSSLTEVPTKSDFTDFPSSQQKEDIQMKIGSKVKSLDSISILDQVSFSGTPTIQTSEVSDFILKSSFATDPSPIDIDTLSTGHMTGALETPSSSAMNTDSTSQHFSVSNVPIAETSDLSHVDPGVVTTEDALLSIASDGADIPPLESRTTVESVLQLTSDYEASTSTLLLSAEQSSTHINTKSSLPYSLDQTILSINWVTRTITRYIQSSGIAETYTSLTDTPRPDLSETSKILDSQKEPQSMGLSSRQSRQANPSIITIKDGLKLLPLSTTEKSIQNSLLQSTKNNQDGDFSTVYKYLTVHRPTSNLPFPLDMLLVSSATRLHDDVSGLSHLVEGVLNSGYTDKLSVTQKPPLMTDSISVSVTPVTNDVAKMETLTPSNSLSVFPSTSESISSNSRLPLLSEGPNVKHIYSDTSSDARVSPTTLFSISSSSIVNERIEIPHEAFHTTAAPSQYSNLFFPEENLNTKAGYYDSLETKFSRPALHNGQAGNGMLSPGLSDDNKERRKLVSSDFPYSDERYNDVFPVPHSNRQTNVIPGHTIPKGSDLLRYEAEKNTKRPESKDDKNLVKPGGIGKDILNMKPLPYKISVSPQFQNHDATPKSIPKQVYGKPKIDWVNWMRNTKAGKNDNAWENPIARSDNAVNGDSKNKNGGMISSSSSFPGTTSYKHNAALHTLTSDISDAIVPSIELPKEADVEMHSFTRTTLYHSTLSPVAKNIEQTQNEVDQELASNNRAGLIEEIRKKVLGASPPEIRGQGDSGETFGTNLKNDLRQKQDETIVDYMKRILPLIERITGGQIKNNESTDILPLYGLNTHFSVPSGISEAQKTPLFHTLPSQISGRSKISPIASVAFERPTKLLDNPVASQNTSMGAPEKYSQTLYAYEDDNYIYEYLYDPSDGVRNLDGANFDKSSDSSRTDSSRNANMSPVKDVDFDNEKSAFKTFKNKADLTTSYKKQQIDDLEQATSVDKDSQWKGLSDSRKRLSDSATSENRRKAESGKGKNLFRFLHNDNTKDRHLSNTNSKKNTYKLSEKIHKFNLNPFGIFSYESAASRPTDYIPSLSNSVFLILFSIMCL